MSQSFLEKVYGFGSEDITYRIVPNELQHLTKDIEKCVFNRCGYTLNGVVLGTKDGLSGWLKNLLDVCATIPAEVIESCITFSNSPFKQTNQKFQPETILWCIDNDVLSSHPDDKNKILSFRKWFSDFVAVYRQNKEAIAELVEELTFDIEKEFSKVFADRWINYWLKEDSNSSVVSIMNKLNSNHERFVGAVVKYNLYEFCADLLCRPRCTEELEEKYFKGWTNIEVNNAFGKFITTYKAMMDGEYKPVTCANCVMFQRLTEISLEVIKVLEDKKGASLWN